MMREHRNEDGDMAEIVDIAQACVEIKDRHDTIEVAARSGRKYTLPIVVDHEGDVSVLNDALTTAQTMDDKLNPARVGTHAMLDLESLIQWVNRFKIPGSTAYFQNDGIVVIINDYLGAEAVTKSAAEVGLAAADIIVTHGAHRDLRATLAIKPHPRLTTWLELAGKWLKGDDFMDFVDINSEDLVSADVASMAKNIAIKNNAVWKRETGADGHPRLMIENSTEGTRVPRTFEIMVPLFDFASDLFVDKLKLELVSKVEANTPVFRFRFLDLEEKQRANRAATMVLFRQQVAGVDAYACQAPRSGQ